MNKVLEFFNKQQKDEVLIKNIRVYGWKFEYDHLLVSSISKYLFEDLDIIENIAPKENSNRDGRIREKKYITVHDTGDTDYDHTAEFWSNVVKVQNWEMGRYEASFQYVTGNDGIYHNIPDDEIAYHAGDSTQFDYALLKTGVKGNNPNPIVTISEKGYYEVDGIETILEAPRAYKERNGNVLINRPAKTTDLNDMNVLCKLVDNEYYIGVTYFNSSYEKIANRGGNNNSIGIESCINIGTDIYLTWQRTAKLVATLLYDNKLSFDNVKQHHYFSGKNCPQSMRMNGLWNHFMDLVKAEYQVLLFKKEGYNISLVIDDKENIAKQNGRLLIRDLNKKYVLKYSIQTEKDGIIEKQDYLLHI